MKILLIAPNRASFIIQDYQNLKETFETNLVICWSLRQILSTLVKVKGSDVCFFWFASIRFIPVFLLAKSLNKKTVVVAGGYDVSRIPEIDYGGIKPMSFTSFLRKTFLHFCDKVITVSNSNTLEAIQNAGVSPKSIERIYLGIDIPKIKLKEWSERKDQVVFIASCDQTSYKIKGFKRFLDLARTMPDITFIHIGIIHVQEFQKACDEIPNVKTLGWVENMGAAFSEILNDSKAILLPSMIESFGVSIVEGGLHGCVPIASDCYSLPEIIGTAGHICQIDDTNCFKGAIRESTSKVQDVQRLQNYFSKRFSANLRKENLINFLRSFF